MINGKEKLVIPNTGFKALADKIKPVVYKGSDYGVSSSLTGKSAKIAVIDTGHPAHKDIKNIKEHVNFSDESDNDSDEYGHSTLVSGFLTSNNKTSVVGIAPDAHLYFAKITNKEGMGDFNALVAALLWSVVKKVDIILLPIGSPIDYPLLKGAITKAFNSNICIFAANAPNGYEGSFFPGDYDEVLSFRAKPSGRDIKNGVSTKGRIVLSMPTSGLVTTSGKDEYTKVYGSSFAAAIGAGLAASLVQDARARGDAEFSPLEVYAALMSLKLN